MPSNQEIQNAVNDAITSNGTIDLLLISDTLDNINGEDIGIDPDYGMNYNYLYIGMSGRRLVDQMNSNWRATDAQFLAHYYELQLRIKSNQVKEIKVENNIIYYTTEELDPEDEEDTRTWVSLQASWGNIAGTLSDQEDLQQALDNKVSYSVFNQLAARVSANENNIVTITGDIATLSNTVQGIISQISGNNGILVRLNALEALIARKITSDDVKQIRTQNGTSLEFTINGTDWYPVSSAGVVKWGDILGNIINQADLQLLFANVNDDISTLNTRVTNHINADNNPHAVNKTQVGLGNVDNTSDMDKPLSNPQQASVQTMIDNSGFKTISQQDYEALQTKNNNVIYFINDL